MKLSGINWTQASFGPWQGCTKVSPGCINCYAEELLENRLRKLRWGPGQPRIRTSPANWRQPLAWNRECERSGARMRVFTAPTADVFDREVPHEWLEDLFRLMETTRSLDWLVLTKRIERAAEHSARIAASPNIWIGTTAENQLWADRRLPVLASIPARVRFVSAEPLLGPLSIANHAGGIDWMICGGESGSNFRPMDPAWPASLRNECTAFGIPFFFKQWSGPRPAGLGRLLDGREWNEIPHYSSN